MRSEWGGAGLGVGNMIASGLCNMVMMDVVLYSNIDAHIHCMMLGLYSPGLKDFFLNT